MKLVFCFLLCSVVACAGPWSVFKQLFGASKPSISTQVLPGGVVGKAYGVQLKAYGGTSPYTWSVTSSTPHSVVLTATPNPVNPPDVQYNYYRCVGTCDATGSYSNIGTGSTVFTDLNAASGNTYTYYATTIEGTQESVPSVLASAVLPVAPIGLSMTSSGWFSGIPTVPFSGVVTFMVIDSANRKRSKTLSLTITQ